MRIKVENKTVMPTFRLLPHNPSFLLFPRNSSLLQNVCYCANGIFKSTTYYEHYCEADLGKILFKKY